VGIVSLVGVRYYAAEAAIIKPDSRRQGRFAAVSKPRLLSGTEAIEEDGRRRVPVETDHSRGTRGARPRERS
jgi:hypothetical protein